MRPAKVAVAGVGHWGVNLLRNFQGLLGSGRVIACDADERRLAAAKSAFPDVAITNNFNALLQDKSVDAMVIATPAATHFELAEAALSAGKHLLVEKPITLRSADAERLITLAEQKKLTLMVDHLLLYHPAVVRLKELMDAGELGEIYYLYHRRTNLGIVRTEENALWSLGPHDIALMLHLLDAEPVSVSAQGFSFLQGGIEDLVFVSLQFPGERFGHLHLSWLDPLRKREVVVVGSRKMAILDETSKEPLLLDERRIDFSGGRPLVSEGRAMPVELGGAREQEPLRAVCEHFLECVETGQRPRSDGRDGLRVVKVLEEAQRSMQGRAVLRP